jgi:hypothetical protein
MKKTFTSGFVTEVENENKDVTLKKLISLKKYWNWTDKIKDQYKLYKNQEDKNPKLKTVDVLGRDSSMFLALYLAMIAQIVKSFEEEPKLVLSAEIIETKDKVGINLNKFGEAVCYPGKDIISDKSYNDVLNQSNVHMVNALHVYIGYYLDKKIQELQNKDVLPYNMN